MTKSYALGLVYFLSAVMLFSTSALIATLSDSFLFLGIFDVYFGSTFGFLYRKPLATLCFFLAVYFFWKARKALKE